MVTPLSYHEFVEAFPLPGCAICNLLSRDAARYLESLLYEYVNEPDTHAVFRAARGLCNEHAWQLTGHKGYVVSMAILYRAALDEVLKTIANVPARPASKAGMGRLLGGNAPGDSELANALEPAASCPVCKMLAETERRYLQAFVGYLSDESFVDAFRRSEGVCLPHLRAILRHIHDPADLGSFLDVQRAIWERLHGELGTFIDQHDHKKRGVIGSERDSHVRAIRGLAGERGIFGVGRRSG